MHTPVIEEKAYVKRGQTMLCTLSDLKDKEVINVCDGRRLGYITDIEIDLCSGRVVRIVLPPQGKYFTFFSTKDNLCIPWENIEKIGSDIILVKYFELPTIK